MGSWAWRLTDTQAAQRPEQGVCVGVALQTSLDPLQFLSEGRMGGAAPHREYKFPRAQGWMPAPGWGWGDGQGGWGSNLVPSQFTRTSCCPCGPGVGLNGSHQHQVSDGFQALPRGWPLAPLEQKGQGWGAREFFCPPPPAALKPSPSPGPSAAGPRTVGVRGASTHCCSPLRNGEE